MQSNEQLIEQPLKYTTDQSKKLKTPAPTSSNSPKSSPNLSREEVVKYLRLVRNESSSPAGFAVNILEYLSTLGLFIQVPFLKMFLGEAHSMLERTIKRENKNKNTLDPKKQQEKRTKELKKSKEAPNQKPTPLIDQDSDDEIPVSLNKSHCEVYKSMAELDKLMEETTKRWRAEQEALDKRTGKATQKKFKVSQMAQYKPEKDQKDLLKIIDLRPQYEVTLLTDYDKDFAAAVKDIFSYQVVGFDGEYRMGLTNGNSSENMASYIQISTPKQCYVFNIAMLSKSKKSIEVLWEICATEKVLKVGQSINEDLQRIFRYFSKQFKIQKRIKLHTCSIDQDLFTIKPPQTYGLSDISYRYLGKYMRKKEKSVRVGSKPNLTSDTHIEYVALDALVPLEIYMKYSDVLKATIPPTAIFGNEDYQKFFFVDKGLKILIQPFEKMKVNAIFLSNVSHQDIVDLCRKFPTRILITHDKSLLLNQKIPNKIPYYSIEQVFAEIDKITLEIPSDGDDESSEEK